MNQAFHLCILRLSAIGDVCHASVMVTRLQQQIPNLRITWVIGKIEHQLLKEMAGVEFVVYDKKGGKQAKQHVIDRLGEQEFDALFIMQVALRANLLSRVIKAKRRIGFDWARSKEGHWLFANERIAAQKHAHVLEGFMAFADTLLATMPAHTNSHADMKSSNDMPRPLITITDEDKRWVREQLTSLSDFVVISPAASKAERNWTAEAYAAIADYCASINKQVVLCGGPGPLDKSLADDILKCTHAISLNLVGKTTLKQMLYVLEQASLVIAPDTGPAHMATCVNTPVVGLYAHSNPKRTGPYASLDNVVSVYDQCIEQQKGKPWQQLPWGIRAKGSDLMLNISKDAVKASINKVLGSSTEKP